MLAANKLHPIEHSQALDTIPQSAYNVYFTRIFN